MVRSTSGIISWDQTSLHTGQVTCPFLVTQQTALLSATLRHASFPQYVKLKGRKSPEKQRSCSVRRGGCGACAMDGAVEMPPRLRHWPANAADCTTTMGWGLERK